MKLVYCSANIYLLLYISHFLRIISCRHLNTLPTNTPVLGNSRKHRCIQAKINEQFSFNVMGRIITIKKELLKYKLISDYKCHFCLNPDSTEHTLYIVKYRMDSFPKLQGGLMNTIGRTYNFQTNKFYLTRSKTPFPDCYCQIQL